MRKQKFSKQKSALITKAYDIITNPIIIQDFIPFLESLTDLQCEKINDLPDETLIKNATQQFLHMKYVSNKDWNLL